MVASCNHKSYNPELKAGKSLFVLDAASSGASLNIIAVRMNILLKFRSQASYQILDDPLSSFKRVAFLFQAFSWTKIAWNSFVLGITYHQR